MSDIFESDNEGRFTLKLTAIQKVKGMVLFRVLMTFLVIYLGINHFTMRRTDLHQFYFDFELAWPLIPWMIVPYASVYFLPVAVLYYTNQKGILKVQQALLGQIAFCGLVFLFFPAELGYHRQAPHGFWNSYYQLLFVIDPPHNLLPSMHVGFAYIWAMALAEVEKFKTRQWRLALLIWFVLVCFSVVLTHQHHLLDIFSGAIVGVVSYGLAGRKLELVAPQ